MEENKSELLLEQRPTREQLEQLAESIHYKDRFWGALRTTLYSLITVAAVAVLGIFFGSTLALRQDKGTSGTIEATARIAPTTGDPVYGYINGQPVTDANVAVRQSEEALRSMGMQMNKSAGYLSSFDGPMERVSAALTNMK